MSHEWVGALGGHESVSRECGDHGGVSKGWGDHGGVSHEGVGCVKFYKSDLRPAPVAFLPLSRFLQVRFELGPCCSFPLEKNTLRHSGFPGDHSTQY